MLEDLLMHYGPHDGLSCGVGFVEERVEVRQQRVADVQVMFGALHQGGLGAVRSWIDPGAEDRKMDEKRRLDERGRRRSRESDHLSQVCVWLCVWLGRTFFLNG